MLGLVGGVGFLVYLIVCSYVVGCLVLDLVLFDCSCLTVTV